MKDVNFYYDNSLKDVGILVKLLVWIGCFFVGGILRIIFRARYENLEVFDRFGREQAVIIAGNHASYTDPCFVFHALWPRRVRFMAKGKLFEHRFLGRLLAFFGVFPVYADARGRQAIKRSVKCLKRGEDVGIFPEGTRVKKRDKSDVPYSDGVALIAKMADVPIVPVGIQGTIDISPDGSKRLHFPKVILRFGEPVYWKDFEPYYERGELMTAISNEVMRRVRALTDGIDPGPTPADVLTPQNKVAKKDAAKASEKEAGQ